jgi:hypothetical protein
MVFRRKRLKMAGKVFLIIGISLLGILQHADAGMDVNIAGGDQGIREFYLAASEYYRIPESEIVIIRERNISDEEIPVVLFIARKARVPYAGVLDLRESGMSWIEITRHYRLNSEIYYVPAKETAGPVYGKAYGYYMKHPRQEWGGARLDDADIVNLVNLKFISNRYGYAPERIMKMRSAGRNFIVIHEGVSSGRWKRGRQHDSDRYGYRGDTEKHYNSREQERGRGRRY